MADDEVPRTLVIGYGSALRGDDAIGRQVAEAVELRRLPGVDVLTTTQLVPELVEPIGAADLVVFVDASVEVAAVTTTVVEPAAGPSASHHSTPAALLALASSLHGRRPRATLVEVPAFELSIGETVSTQARSALPVAVACVVELVDTPP